MSTKIADASHSARPHVAPAPGAHVAAPAPKAPEHARQLQALADQLLFHPTAKRGLVAGVGEEPTFDAASESRAATWRALDTEGVAYAPFADETGKQGGVRTNYALVAKDAGAVVLALDNGNIGTKGYEGFSAKERGFALDVVEYAKSKGLPVLAFAHIPPNYKGRHAKHDARTDDHRQWISALREKIYPNVLFVFGHVHPDPTRLDPKDEDVDFDQLKDGKADVDGMIIGGEVQNCLAKITLYEKGRAIEDFKVEKNGKKSTGRVFLSAEGQVVSDAAQLGKKTGVFYGTSDIQRDGHLVDYFKALDADARTESGAGVPVYYLVAGDVMLDSKHIPVHLPQHEHVLYSPGNHCYQNHDSLKEVLDFLQPADGPVKMVVNYVEK